MSGEIVRECLTAALAAVTAAEDELGRLDSVAGDGDHGTGMVRGFQAAVASITDESAGQVLVNAGTAFADASGGASGALVGIFITTLGSHLPNDVLNASYVHHALVMALAAIGKLGKSKVGDKTMIDTLDPFVNAYGERATSATISQAWLQALPAAEAGMKATADMVSKRGRSSLLKARSLGHLDPGAVSIYYVLRAVSGVLTIRCP